MKFPSANEILIEDAERIETLIKSHFQKISTHQDGWTILYIDPNDKRHWELTYPNSEQHGGGLPLLKFLERSSACQIYAPTLSVMTVNERLFETKQFDQFDKAISAKNALAIRKILESIFVDEESIKKILTDL